MNKDTKERIIDSIKRLSNATKKNQEKVKRHYDLIAELLPCQTMVDYLKDHSMYLYRPDEAIVSEQENIICRLPIPWSKDWTLCGNFEDDRGYLEVTYNKKCHKYVEKFGGELKGKDGKTYTSELRPYHKNFEEYYNDDTYYKVWDDDPKKAHKIAQKTWMIADRSAIVTQETPYYIHIAGNDDMSYSVACSTPEKVLEIVLDMCNGGDWPKLEKYNFVFTN